MSSTTITWWRCDCCGVQVQNDGALPPAGWTQDNLVPKSVLVASDALAEKNLTRLATLDAQPVALPPAGDLCEKCSPAPDWTAAATVSASDVVIPRPITLPIEVPHYKGATITHELKSCGKSFTADFDGNQRTLVCPHCGNEAEVPKEYFWVEA